MSDLMQISLTVNGTRFERLTEPRRLLVDFLREDLGLVGTHVGCEHGVCGTCTVLFDGESIRSCLMLAVQAHGGRVETVEGLASGGRMNALQEAFRQKQGLQCGYCTPGMLMRATELLRERPNPTREDVRAAISSNLCRCTGYQFIVDAIMLAAESAGATADQPAAATQA